MKKFENWLLYKVAYVFKDFFVSFVSLFPWLIRTLILTVRDHYYDKKLGIETSRHYYPKEDQSTYKDMNPYEPLSYKNIKKIIDYLRLVPDDVFIDFGCGKGRVVFAVAQHKLKKVIGIELDKEMFAIARLNQKSLKFNKAPIEIINVDAANFEINEETIFFMYDPFGYKTLETVLERIKKSLRINPRRIRIIYCSPTYRFLLDSQDWLELEKIMGKEEILIWQNKY
ncbi:MAG: methyltransferase domain-containing protein [Candidatus Omnitrophica bacterium]|nr:methyltransferase domain-containing protein [Candidatus Omnitrophota bacterium]MCM8771107.1 methyltransferase domain-containing protein [Candidatus Omnitrophota bacterium]